MIPASNLNTMDLLGETCKAETGNLRALLLYYFLKIAEP